MADLLKKDEIEAHTLLTVKEVREVFGIARSTVYRWIDRCWLRKAGQVQAPEDYKNQKIVLLDLVDEDLLQQFAAWVRSETDAGRTPRFFADDLARVDPLPEEEVDPRIESKRLVGELQDLMGRLDHGSAERNQLVEELDAAPAIQPSGIKQANDGLKEIVDLLKEISVREDDLRDETIELPQELGVPTRAAKSEDFVRELGEERGKGLEPSPEDEDPVQALPTGIAGGDTPDPRDPREEWMEEDDEISEPEEISADRDQAGEPGDADDSSPEEPGFGLDLGDTEPFEGFDPEDIAEFAFLPDPETLGEEGEWIELNIDDSENPLLREELVALDEKFLPGARRRGIEIDFEKGMLSETELDELAAAQEEANESRDDETSGSTPSGEDEENDSWLGISIDAEPEALGDPTEEPYDPTGNLLEGDELRLLHADVEEGAEVEGFYLDLEPHAADGSDLLDRDSRPSGEGWGEGDEQVFDEQMQERWTPAAGDHAGGIHEDMLTGADAIDLEPDDEVRELDEAYAAEEAEDADRGRHEDADNPTVDEPVAALTLESSDDVALDEILSAVDAGSSRQDEEPDEEVGLSLEDLEDLGDEDDVLMSLDDLDDEFDLAVEEEVEEIPDEDLYEPDSAIDDHSDSAEDSKAPIEPGPSPESSATDEPIEIDTPIPVAARTEERGEPDPAPTATVPGPGLTAEALADSAEMIKEGMIGIRLSILEVKEGLGILQDPVDSVSRNTEKVSEGVRLIAEEARETRRSIEDLGLRLASLDLSALRPSAGPRTTHPGRLVTWIGLTLLVLTWGLGLYLRGQGNMQSLYGVFGANLLITFAILLMRSPRAPLEEPGGISGTAASREG